MTRPGMPMRAGDPGVFICGPGDIAPWENEPVRPPAAPAARRPAPVAVWLVARACPGCHLASDGETVYCGRHNDENWWLTEYNGPPFGKRLRGSDGV